MGLLSKRFLDWVDTRYTCHARLLLGFHRAALRADTHISGAGTSDVRGGNQSKSSRGISRSVAAVTGPVEPCSWPRSPKLYNDGRGSRLSASGSTCSGIPSQKGGMYCLTVLSTGREDYGGLDSAAIARRICGHGGREIVALHWLRASGGTGEMLRAIGSSRETHAANGFMAFLAVPLLLQP